MTSSSGSLMENKGEDVTIKAETEEQPGHMEMYSVQQL